MVHWLVRIVVILGALLNSVIGVLSLFAPEVFLAIIGHRNPHLTIATQVYADYLGTRELAIGVALVFLLVTRSTRVLPCLMVMVAFANALDGVNALAIHRWVQAPGAFVFAIVYLVAALWLFRHHRGAESRQGRPDTI